MNTTITIKGVELQIEYGYIPIDRTHGDFEIDEIRIYSKKTNQYRPTHSRKLDALLANELCKNESVVADICQDMLESLAEQAEYYHDLKQEEQWTKTV